MIKAELTPAAERGSVTVTDDTLIKLVGQKAEIIYQDKSGNITQRKIEVHGIKNGLLRAHCLTTDSPRAFRAERILAWRPLRAGYAG